MGISVQPGASTLPVMDGIFYTHLAMKKMQKALPKCLPSLITLQALCAFRVTGMNLWHVISVILVLNQNSHDKFTHLPSDKFSHDDMFMSSSLQLNCFMTWWSVKSSGSYMIY